VIFPRQCKEIGSASTRPCGDKVYFLSRYLVKDTPSGPEVREVVPNPDEKGLMRTIREDRLLASARDVTVHPVRVNIHNRALLVKIALESGTRCTIFTGLDEHTTFVMDPDPGIFHRVHVYDIIPPRPSLSSAIRELEHDGLFGDLDVMFEHHLHDITGGFADMYPCRAAGFSRTLDADRPHKGEKIAGCFTGSQLLSECYGEGFGMVETCPLRMVRDEPFIARCCRKEREGVKEYERRLGAVVHWGANPSQIYQAVCMLLQKWRERS